MPTQMTPDTFVHKMLGFSRAANDPEVQSIVDEMHATFDAAAEAVKGLNVINDNIPEMVIFDQNGRGLNMVSAQAAIYSIFSDDKKVANAAKKMNKVLWKNRNEGQASRADFNQLLSNLASNPFFSGGDPHIFDGDVTKLLERLKPLPDSAGFEVHKFSVEILEAWWNVKFPQGRSAIKAPVNAGVETPAARVNNKTQATLKFEAAAMKGMTSVWNDWKKNHASDKTLKEPTKGEMHQAVLNKLLADEVHGRRKKPNPSMVKDATKSWTKPASVKGSVSPALAPAKRHSFKGVK
jgi:hypothetical protein